MITRELSIVYNLSTIITRELSIVYNLSAITSLDSDCLYDIQPDFIGADLQVGYDISETNNLIFTDMEVGYNMPITAKIDFNAKYDLRQFNFVSRDFYVQYHVLWDEIESISYSYLRD